MARCGGVGSIIDDPSLAKSSPAVMVIELSLIYGGSRGQMNGTEIPFLASGWSLGSELRMVFCALFDRWDRGFCSHVAASLVEHALDSSGKHAVAMDTAKTGSAGPWKHVGMLQGEQCRGAFAERIRDCANFSSPLLV